jgi:hypothetical protein
MVSVIQYGGRITDDFDQLLMDTFAEKYFHAGVLQVRGRAALCSKAFDGAVSIRAWERRFFQMARLANSRHALLDPQPTSLL